MDVHVRYWSKSEIQICVHNQLTIFIHVINNVDGGKHMIQISMDGPSANWKFFKMLYKDHRKDEQNELMNVELCSLHIKHTLKTAAESSRWNIKPVFNRIFTILHDTPARRENYIAITEEERSPFFFCEARWFGEPNCCGLANKNWQYNQNC